MEIEEIEKILKKYGINDPSPLPLDSSPIKTECEELHKQYNEAITANERYGASPALFFVNTERGFRAFALRHVSGLGIINVSPELVTTLNENLRKKDDLLKLIIQKRNCRFNPEDIREYAYWTTFHYIFYHEFAHLIQNTAKIKEEAIDFDDPSSNNFSLEYHILEADADEFSALCLTTHIKKDIIKNESFTTKDVEDFCICALVPIIFTVVNQHLNFKEFYLKAKKHPHPLIRLILLSLVLLEFMNQTLLRPKGMNDIDHSAVVNDSIDIVIEYFEKYKADKRMSDSRMTIKKNFNELMEYVKELREKQKGLKTSAVIAWNKNLK